MNKCFIFTINKVEGGAGRRLVEFLNYLSRKNIKSYLICYKSEMLGEIDRSNTLKIYELSTRVENTLYYSVQSFFLILFILLKKKKVKVDAVSYAGNSGLSLALLKTVFNRNLSFTIFLRGNELNSTKIRSREIYQWEFIGNLHVKLHEKIMRFIISKSDTLISQSETGLSTLRSDYSKSIPDQTYILPNNCNTEWIKRSVKEAKFRHFEMPKLAKNTFKICWVGRVSIHLKGLDVVIRVVENLVVANLHVFIVGDGKDLDKMKIVVKNKGLSNKFTFMGFMKNPLLVLEQTDLLLVPSRSEAYPNVIFEAMALGKPVLGSNVDGIPEILGSDELLFFPDSEGDLERKIERACKDIEYYNMLQSTILKRREKFTFDWSERLMSII